MRVAPGWLAAAVVALYLVVWIGRDDRAGGVGRRMAGTLGTPWTGAEAITAPGEAQQAAASPNPQAHRAADADVAGDGQVSYLPPPLLARIGGSECTCSCPGTPTCCAAETSEFGRRPQPPGPGRLAWGRCALGLVPRAALVQGAALGCALEHAECLGGPALSVQGAARALAMRRRCSRGSQARQRGAGTNARCSKTIVKSHGMYLRFYPDFGKPLQTQSGASWPAARPWAWCGSRHHSVGALQVGGHARFKAGRCRSTTCLSGHQASPDVPAVAAPPMKACRTQMQRLWVALAVTCQCRQPRAVTCQASRMNEE